MSFVKTPTSSLTATELFVMQLWYRSKARVKALLYGATLDTPTARPPPIARLPQDLIETIVSYFIYDTHTLLACSATCYSWYIAAVPHLHHSLTTDSMSTFPRTLKYQWPRPLRESYKLGLLPLVKRFRIRLAPASEFTRKCLCESTLRYFSALTNLQELGIDYLQVSSFMPNIQQCFGHFAPTLRFLALREPRGSRRQILYFIGLFPNLQDLKICYSAPKNVRESRADAELVPLSVPPLRGRLTLTCFTRKKLVEDMITIFGGLHFRHMDLYRVRCVRLLLGACAETLETLRVYSTDPYVSGQAVRRDFDLSRNRSLRTLETTAESMVGVNASPSFLTTILSTVTSPLPLNVVIVYYEYDVRLLVCGWGGPIRLDSQSQNARTSSALNHQERFKVLIEMYRVRGFQLVCCADVLDFAVEYVVGVLERVVEEERMNGGLGYLLSEPLIISERRSPRTRIRDMHVGNTGKWPINASAL